MPSPQVWFLENAFTLGLCVTGRKVWPGDTAPCCQLQLPGEVFSESITREKRALDLISRHYQMKQSWDLLGRKVHILVRKREFMSRRSALEKNNSHLSVNVDFSGRAMLKCLSCSCTCDFSGSQIISQRVC